MKACPLPSYKELPSKYKNKPIGKVFSVKDVGNAIIRFVYWCDSCSHWAEGIKCSCGRKKRKAYIVEVCRYNDWGCGNKLCAIHPKSKKHPFVCTCDECY